METAKNEFKKLYPDELIENINVYMNAIEMIGILCGEWKSRGNIQI